jgi:hypothetical protein
MRPLRYGSEVEVVERVQSIAAEQVQSFAAD